jgi:hypothetical protein
MSFYANGHSAATIFPPTTAVLTGASLAHRRLDKRQRAVLAADIFDGQRYLPSKKELVHLFGVSLPYIEIALRLTPDLRRAILNGRSTVSFVDLARSPRQLKLPMCASITNQQLEHVIRIAGVERALAAACAVENNT